MISFSHETGVHKILWEILQEIIEEKRKFENMLKVQFVNAWEFILCIKLNANFCWLGNV
jgi:hypothetical protein